MNDQVQADILSLCAMCANLSLACANLLARQLAPDAPSTARLKADLDATRDAIARITARYAGADVLE